MFYLLLGFLSFKRLLQKVGAQRSASSQASTISLDTEDKKLKAKCFAFPALQGHQIDASLPLGGYTPAFKGLLKIPPSLSLRPHSIPCEDAAAVSKASVP